MLLNPKKSTVPVYPSQSRGAGTLAFTAENSLHHRAIVRMHQSEGEIRIGAIFLRGVAGKRCHARIYERADSLWSEFIPQDHIRSIFSKKSITLFGDGQLMHS